MVRVETSSLVSRLEANKAKRLKLTSLCKFRDQTLGIYPGTCKCLSVVWRIDYLFKS